MIHWSLLPAVQSKQSPQALFIRRHAVELAHFFGTRRSPEAPGNDSEEEDAGAFVIARIAKVADVAYKITHGQFPGKPGVRSVKPFDFPSTSLRHRGFRCLRTDDLR